VSAATVETFEAGFYPDVPEQEYLSGRFGPEGSLSASGIKTLLKAPSLFRWERDNPRDETDSMRLGTVTHELLLGAGPGFIVLPPYTRSKADQEAKKETIAAAVAAGKAYVTEEQFEHAENAVKAVRADRDAARLLDSAWQPEVSAYAPDEETGVWRRCRFDILRDDNLAIDVKTARAARAWEFSKACHEFGYYISAPYYSDIAADLGRPLTDYAFLVVEPKPPYLVAVYRLEERALELGREHYRRGLQRYRDCMETNRWPGLDIPDNHTIGLPRYAYQEN
jgi:hypothetical protein